MRERLLGLVAVAMVAWLATPARATLTTYLDLPGVDGESDAPGRTDVTALDSLTLEPHAFAVTKLVDSTSPGLASAAVGGTPYASASLLFYDAVFSDTQPDAELLLGTSLITSIQPVALGPNPGETVTFSFASPSLALFLELPGVTGESSAPGHSGVIALDSLELSASGFAVRKAVDSTSPALNAALVSGTPYASATLLLYSNLGSQTQPDFSLVYQNALVTSLIFAPPQNRERWSFAVDGAAVQAPEPAATSLLGAALLAAARARTRRSSVAGG